MRPRLAGLTGLVLLLSVFLGLAVAGGTAAAAHGPEEANFTVEPLGDRSPGATNVEYGQTVVATAGVDLETLTRTLAVYEAGGWSGCGPTDASVFGIDRGDTYDGYEIDEELTNNVKSFSSGEDRLETEYNGEDDLGASTYLDDGDELVSVADCIDNPDQPGWYQIVGRTTGVTATGEEVTYGGRSHYFWICDCEDESEARDRLGPPPSEPQTTATATATPTPAEGTRTETSAEDGATGTASRTPTGTTPTATATTGPATDRPSTATATPTETPGSWADSVYRTPTRNEGSGFGTVAALAGLLAAAVAALSRR